MPHDTDERLRSRLDTNQLGREELCLGILALDNRFSDVKPRHPRGGPDGGRDIDAVYRGNQTAAVAVGFVNGANDSKSQKAQIRKKFQSDVDSAKAGSSGAEVFVFMTNLALTMGEQDVLKKVALGAGFAVCEVFDRNLMRAMLDSPDGFALRFQYLALSLSDAEQASFFAKWGDGIQNLVSSSFQRVERTLEQILFLQEANDVLSGIHVHFELDRLYYASEIGHFRAFIRMFLREPKHRIFQLLYGSSDRQMRFRESMGPHRDPAGIGASISGGQWENYVDLSDADGPAEADQAAEEADDDSDPDSHQEQWVACGASSSIGADPVSQVVASYNHDGGFIRLQPRMTLRDLDDSGWIALLNRSLAEKVAAIHVYANGYKLSEVRKSDFGLEAGPPVVRWPCVFAPAELADPWVRIRPKTASFFTLRFSEVTPVRIFAPARTNESMDYLKRRAPD